MIVASFLAPCCFRFYNKKENLQGAVNYTYPQSFIARFRICRLKKFGDFLLNLIWIL